MDQEYGYRFFWKRNKSQRGQFSEYTILVDSSFSPTSERIKHHRTEKKTEIVDREYYQYEDDVFSTHSDTNVHNGAFFEMKGVANAFNWEMDLEVLSLLRWEEGKTYAIKFYHPGSKQAPNYYDYSCLRSEKLELNDSVFSCYVVRVQHGSRQETLFWIDKSTHCVLQVRDLFYGRFRYKKRVI
jgi:hypothetical protein